MNTIPIHAPSIQSTPVAVAVTAVPETLLQYEVFSDDRGIVDAVDWLLTDHSEYGYTREQIEQAVGVALRAVFDAIVRDAALYIYNDGRGGWAAFNAALTGGVTA